MRKLEQITKFVIPFSSIPKEKTIGHWLNDYNKQHTYVEVHVDPEDEEQKDVTIWIMLNYPFLINEESFFIHMD